MTSSPSDIPVSSGRAPRGWGFRALRFAVLGVALVVLVISAAVGVLTSLLSGGNPALSRQVVLVLNRQIGTDSTRVEVDRVSGTLFRGAVLDRPRLIVKTSDGEVTWASARSVRVDYDLYGLLFTKNRSLTAVIDSPLVRLVHDRAGRVVFPKFASHPSRRGTGGTTRVSIAAKNGVFSLDWKRLRFTQVQGRGVLALGPGQSALVLEELSGLPDPAARSRGRVHAKGGMTVIGSDLRVDPLEVTYGDSRVRGSMDWDLRHGRAADGLLRLDPLRLADVSGLVGAGSADGRLRGELSFEGTPTEGKATACLTGTVNGETLDTLAVTAALAPKAITFSGLRVRARGAEATGGGVWTMNGPIAASLTFHGLDPGAVPWWKAPEGMPRGSLAGTARLLVRFLRPRATVAASVGLDQSRFGRLDIRQGLLHVATAPDGSTVLDSSWIDVPGGRLSGRAHLLRGETLEAHVVGTIEDLTALNRLMAPVAAQSGRGRVTADLTGSIRSPDFEARAALWDGRLTNGAAYDSLQVSAAGRLGEGGSARAYLSARGIRAGTRPLGNATASVAFGKRIVIERYVQSAGDSTLSFRGIVTPGREETTALLDSVVLTAGTLRFQNLEPVRLAIREGHVRSQSLPLDLRPGRADLAFDWDVSHGRIDADGRLSGVDVTRIPGLAASRDSLRGQLGGTFHVSGPFADPALNVEAQVLRPAWAGVTGDSLTVALAYAPGVLRIDRARWAADDGRAALTGTIRAPVSLEAWLRGIAKRDESWAKNAALDLDARVDSLDLSLLAPADTSLRSLEGTATFTAHVTGTGLSPVAAINATSPRILYRGIEGAVTGAELNYAERSLHITRLDVTQSGSISSITGQIPVDLSIFAKERLLRDRPLQLTLRVTDADFKLASVIYPAYVASSAGKFSVMAGVSGTARAPAIQGTVRLKDATVRFAGREEVVSRIQIEGAFDQNQLTITSMAGAQGTKGTLTGSGTWQWGGLTGKAVPVAAGPPGKYQFKVNAANFTVTDRETYAMQLTGTFTIANGRTEGGRQIPFITGASTLSKGNLTLDLAATDREEVVLPFHYDVSVDVPQGLFYRTVDSEVELQGNLRLVNKGNGNLALGTMTVRKGRYYLFTREIQNLTGDFIFNSLDRTDPELAVDGETTIPVSKGSPTVIKVSLTGRASRPEVHLWDPNPDSRLTQADLWRMLTYGQLSPSIATGEAEAGGNGGIGGGVPLPIQAYLFRNAERWLSESGWIDTFDLGTGGRAGGEVGTGPIDVGIVGAGKYVTRDLYINYSREFSGAEEKRLGAEYRVTRHLLLKGERTDRNATPGSRPAEEYNLDLKVRLEY